MPAISILISMDDPPWWRRWRAQVATGDARIDDATAFEQLVASHAPLVLRTAQRLLLNEADAEDAAQEVFLKIHRFYSKFDGNRDLLPWLYRITVNVCHDLRRKRQRALSLDAGSDAVAAGTSDPEQVVNTQERRTLLLEALRVLSDRERETIVLRDLEGLTTAEVAAALGTNEATVRSQISSGRMKLRNYLTRKLGRRR